MKNNFHKHNLVHLLEIELVLDIVKKQKCLYKVINKFKYLDNRLIFKNMADNNNLNINNLG